MNVLTTSQAAAILPVLKAWEEWRLAGAPECDPFTRNLGLCEAVVDHYVDNMGAECMATTALQTMFRHEGLNPTYPFGEHEFHLSDVLHLDTNRIAFVQRWIAQLEEELK